MRGHGGALLSRRALADKVVFNREVCFVVAGAAHMGGPNGVIALLRARGYRVEEL